MLPSPKNGRLGLRVLSFRGHMGLPHYGPVTRSPSFSDGFVNGLQNEKFPSRPAIPATGLGLLPRWDLLPLIMPAFAGRTVFGTNLPRRPRTPYLSFGAYSGFLTSTTSR